MRGTGGLTRRVIDGRNAGCAEIARLLCRGREGDRRRGRAAVTEAVVVAVVEDLILPRAQRNQRTADIDAVLVAMLEGLDRQIGRRIGDLSKPAPGIQRGIPEELVDRAVILGATLLDAVVHHALAFVDGRVACGLHLELVDRVH